MTWKPANPDNASLDCDDMAAAYASKPLPQSPFFAAPPEDPSELLVGVVRARRDYGECKECGGTPPNHEDGCSKDPLREPTTGELPALLERHAERLAEMGHYDIAADVQLASEILSREGSGA